MIKIGDYVIIKYLATVNQLCKNNTYRLCTFDVKLPTHKGMGFSRSLYKRIMQSYIKSGG